MSVKMRLARGGRKKKPVYSIVIADARAPRDGRFIDKLGQYNPNTIPATISLDSDRALEWLQKGAQPTNTVKAILSFKGVLYRKHLQRGVAKGALTQEQADAKFEDWMANKSQEIDSRRDKHRADVLQKKEEVLAAGAEKAAAKAAQRNAVVAEGASEEAQSELDAEVTDTEATEVEEGTDAAEAMAAVEEQVPDTEAKEETLEKAQEQE